jgi:hypothetical protein
MLVEYLKYFANLANFKKILKILKFFKSFSSIFQIILKMKWTNLFCSAKKLFCSVNFFPAKIFSGILEKGNLSEQEKILAGKNSLSKKGFSL